MTPRSRHRRLSRRRIWQLSLAMPGVIIRCPSPLPQALDGEAQRHARTAMHPDAHEAGAAFAQKREPVFEGTPPLEPWRRSKL